MDGDVGVTEPLELSLVVVALVIGNPEKLGGHWRLCEGVKCGCRIQCEEMSTFQCNSFAVFRLYYVVSDVPNRAHALVAAGGENDRCVVGLSRS